MVPLTTTAHDPRTSKALELVKGAASWLRITNRKSGRHAYGTPSSVAGRYYVVTRDSCDCPDATRRGVTCKHQAAVRLVCTAATVVGENQARQGVKAVANAILFGHDGEDEARPVRTPLVARIMA